MKDFTIYSTSFGGVDSACLPPDTDARCIMFTDRKSKWVCSIPPPHRASEQKAVRALKTHPDVWFDETTLYMDANVILPGNIDQIVKDFEASGCSVALAPHALRDCLYEEASLISKINDPTKRKYDNDAISAQITSYRDAGFPENAGMWQGGLILRKNNKEARKFSRLWWDEIVLHGHYRDQLSLAYIASDFSIYELPPFETTPHTYAASMASKYDDLGDDYHWKWIEQGQYTHVASVERAIKLIPKSDRIIVDFGSSDGVASSLLTNKGRRVIGVEVLDGPRRIAEAKVPQARFVKELSAPIHDSYDMLMMEVLGHVEDEALANVIEIIDLSVCAIITVPHSGMDAWAVRDVSMEWLDSVVKGRVSMLYSNGDGVAYMVENGSAIGDAQCLI